MKKNVSRLITVLLAATLISTTAGCGKSTKETASESEAATSTGYPIVSKPLTLSMFCAGPNTKVTNSIGDLETMQAIEKKTGITIKFIHPSSSDKGEALSTLLASGDYPDMIRNKMDTYKGGVEGAIKDGIIVDSTKNIQKYAVNYEKMIKDNKQEKLVLSDTGKDVVFGSSFTPQSYVGKTFAGLVIRQDWLDELGLKVPTTIDEWYTVLKAFKEKKGCQSPLGLSNLFTSTQDVSNERAQAFVGSYDAAYTFMLSNDKVVYGPLQPGFKSFLETFSKWYKEGLINKDLATQDYTKNIQPMLANGQVGACTSHPIGFQVVYAMVDKAKNPNYKLAPAPYPQAAAGKECNFRPDYTGVTVNPILITTKCKNQIEAIRFVDFFYSQEGINMCTWGLQEGKTYKKDSSGNYSVGDLISKNPDGLSFQDAREKYTLNDLQLVWNWDWEKLQYAMPEQQNSTWGIWSTSAKTTNHIPDLITMSAEETSAFTGTMSQIDTYSQEMILKFITGQEPLSNYDKYAATIKSMGIDKAIASKQAAYDRYKKR